MAETRKHPDLSAGSNVSIGDKYGYAMEIRDEAEASRYLEACIAHCMSFGKTRDAAEKIEAGNLGYYAGYYNNETRQRVERLFRCAHPVFGKATEKPVDPQAAFSAGVALAKGKVAGSPPEEAEPA